MISVAYAYKRRLCIGYPDRDVRFVSLWRIEHGPTHVRHARPWFACRACRFNRQPAVDRRTFFCRHDHRQVRVGDFYCDQGIADDIRALFDQGIRTWVSCQGHEGGRGRYISVSSPRDRSAALAVLPDTYCADPKVADRIVRADR